MGLSLAVARRPPWAFLVLVGMGALAWGPVVQGGLVSDDWVWLERVRLHRFVERGQFFRPLLWLSWWAQSSWGPRGLHLWDVASHCAAGYLLFRVCRLVARPEGAWAAAMVFCTLPALHEAVCWTSARSYAMASALVLASLEAGMVGRRALAAGALTLALATHEGVVGLAMGLPLVLLTRGRRREAGAWLLLTLLAACLVVGTGRVLGAYVGLRGGYVAPWKLSRTLAHLGSYLGLAVGVENAQRWWVLWLLLGLGCAGAAWRGHVLPGVLWVWATLSALPFVRLGGPPQPRFLYVMVLPPLVGLAWSASRIPTRWVAPVLALSLASWQVPQARAACREWVEASGEVARVLQLSARTLRPGVPTVVVHPPEWWGRAHVLRNGLFSALRLTSGESYVGLTVPPSEGLVTCGDLVAWLASRAPSLLAEPDTRAWLFTAHGLCPLKRWRDPTSAPSPLEEACGT